MKEFLELVSLLSFATLFGMLTLLISTIYIESDLAQNTLAFNATVVAYLWAAANLEIKQERV